MKHYAYIEPRAPGENDWTPVLVTVSEDDIIREYWPYWSGEMRRNNAPSTVITAQNCIRDWIVVNYAIEVDKRAPREPWCGVMGARP